MNIDPKHFARLLWQYDIYGTHKEGSVCLTAAEFDAFLNLKPKGEGEGRKAVYFLKQANWMIEELKRIEKLGLNKG